MAARKAGATAPAPTGAFVLRIPLLVVRPQPDTIYCGRIGERRKRVNDGSGTRFVALPIRLVAAEVAGGKAVVALC